MNDRTVMMTQQKTVAVVAHDNKKQDFLAWAKFNREALGCHRLIATGTTGKLLQEELGLPMERVQSGPLGGDQQIGAKISEGEIDILIVFWDPAGAASARSRCEGAAQDRRGLEYSHRLQSGVRRFPDFLIPHAEGV